MSLLTRAAVAGLVLLSVVSGGRADDAPAPAPPTASVEVPERVWDAGKVDRGTTIRHEFLLRNLGPAELSVDAKPG